MKINYIEPTTTPEIYNQVIWFNSQHTGQKFYCACGMYQAGTLHLKGVYSKDLKQFDKYAEIQAILLGNYNYLE